MRIVGPIQFWRGYVIYRSAPKNGFGPGKNADSVHAKVDSVQAKMLTPFTPEHIPFFRALLEIEIETKIKIEIEMLTRFTPEHIPVFRALLKIKIEI